MKVRYIVLILLVLLSVITYMDRICIGVAATQMQQELGISEQHWGWVLGAFLLAYGIFEIPTGALGDWIGQRKVLTRIVVWWSAFTMLTPLATNFWMLVATRFLFGAGEAGAYPNAAGSISRWFPVVERARAQGLVWAASRVGGALTPILVVPLMMWLGWKACFWLFGAIGLVWAAVWVLWYRDDPKEHPQMTPQELKEIGAGPQRGSHSAIPWRPLFASGQLWLIIAMYWFYVFAGIFFMFWLPKYLTQGRGLSEGAMAVCVALTFTMGAMGNTLAGLASDALSKRYGLAIGRKAIGVSCLLLSGLLMLAAALTPAHLPWPNLLPDRARLFLLAAGLTMGNLITGGLLILSFGILDGMLPCSWAICLDVGKRYSGAVSGAMNTAGQASGYICTVLYGYLVAWMGSYDRPLLILAPSLFVSAACFALIDPTRPLVPESAEPVAIAAEEAVCV